MRRKFDYLQQKTEEQPYNFLDNTQFNHSLLDHSLNLHRHVSRNKNRTMHTVIPEGETISLNRYKRQYAYQYYNHKLQNKKSFQTRTNNNFLKDNIDIEKQQFTKMKIRYGIQKNINHQFSPSRLCKKKTSIFDRQAQAIEQKLKNRLNSIKVAKLASKNRQLQNTAKPYSKRQIKSCLQKRIDKINKTVQYDAQSIQLKFNEIEPMNHMQKIRKISESRHKSMKTTLAQNTNIQDDIVELRKLMRTYIKKQ